MRRMAPESHSAHCLFTDGANRDRTGDLLVANQALSQLSYGPELFYRNNLTSTSIPAERHLGTFVSTIDDPYRRLA